MYSHMTQAFSVAAVAIAAAATFLSGATDKIYQVLLAGPETGFRSTVHQDNGQTRFEMTADLGEIECELDLEFAVRDTSNQSVDVRLDGRPLMIKPFDPRLPGPGTFSSRSAAPRFFKARRTARDR